MKDLVQRIAECPPEKRELLERLLEAQGIKIPAPADRTGDAKNKAKMSEVLHRAAGDATYGSMIQAQYTDKARVQKTYNTYHEHLKAAVFENQSFFMNLGYVASDRRQYSLVQLPNHIVNRNFIKLVLEVIGNCPLSGRMILDVGCGRGGTIHVAHRYFEPKATVGADLSAGAVAFCKRQHRHSNTRFVRADAEKFPFGDLSFDVVINVESSHHYPEIDAFYREVARTLRPGGHFVYATMLPIGRFSQDLDCLAELGLAVERDEDITGNVLASCDQCGEQIFAGIGHTGADEGLANAASLPGSQTYENMRRGITAYRMFTFQKRL